MSKRTSPHTRRACEAAATSFARTRLSRQTTHRSAFDEADARRAVTAAAAAYAAWAAWAAASLSLRRSQLDVVIDPSIS